MGGSEAIGLGGEALERDEGDDMGEIGDGTSTSMILFQIHTQYYFRIWEPNRNLIL